MARENPIIVDEEARTNVQGLIKEIRALIGIEPSLPPSLQGLEERPEEFTPIESDYAAFKEFLVGNYRG